jgi:hypothetical protein
MMDWYAACFGALWILGLSLILASLSYANYLVSQQQKRFVTALQIPARHFMIHLGLVFFCLGWAGSATGIWERFAWIVLALLFGLRIWRGGKPRNI